MKKQESLKSQVLPEEKQIKLKASKPWYLESRIVDEAYANKNSFFANKQKLGEWVKDSWFDSLLSLSHGIDKMNTIARTTMVASKDKSSITDHWRFAGKEFRLVNRETQEIVSLSHTDTEFYAKKETQD